MKKAIIALSGTKEQKTKFLQVAKNEDHSFYPEDGWWIWSINATDVAGVAARTLGAGALKDEAYYEFVGKLKRLANMYYDFEINYIREMVEKFLKDKRAEILVVHTTSPEAYQYLKESYNLSEIIISDMPTTEKGFVESTINLLEKITL